MKNEKITGYIDYQNEEYIFILEDYILHIMPSSFKKIVDGGIAFLLNPIAQKNSNGFLEDLVLEGVKMDGKKIDICVQGRASCTNGTFAYKVKWFYTYTCDTNNLKIKGINFISPEINYICSTKRYISDDYNLKGVLINDYNLKIKNLDRQLLGSFDYKNQNIKIYGSMSWKRKNNDLGIIEMWSKLILEFDKRIDVKELYSVVLLQKCVIDFLTYRNNNSFNTIETYSVDINNKPYTAGKFYINLEKNLESDSEKVERLISADNVPNFGNIYELINNNIIYLNHLCDSFDKRKVYGPHRMLSILVAFERFFNSKFDNKEIRDDNYLLMLKKVVDHLKQEKNNILGDLKASVKYNKLVNRISKAEVDYASRLRYVINKYPIAISYIKNIYNQKASDKMINIITERIGKLRNDMAHGNANIIFTSENTMDLKFMEILFYIIILSDLKVNDNAIINKINWLFDVKLFMK